MTDSGEPECFEEAMQVECFEEVMGCVLANSFANPWYWVNRSIFPLYFPYKRKHCNTTVYGNILYWKRDCESVKRKCNSFAAGCIPSSF